MKRIAIIGLGLMGGSLGLAARRSGKEVAAYARRAESRQAALDLGVADAVFESPSDAVAGADLVVLCTPILTMPALVKSFRHNLADGCIVTDVGSTKTLLTDEIGELLRDSAACYVGSHPMAGSEKNGIEAAASDLYEGATVFVTLESGCHNSESRAVAEFWEAVGSNVVLMTPQAHDEIVARVSHLPHLAASVLMNTVAREDDDIGAFCGPGLRDATRIAEGSELVWHDIVKSNQSAVLAEVEAFSERLEVLKKMLKRQDFEGIREMLRTARENRARL